MPRMFTTLPKTAGEPRKYFPGFRCRRALVSLIGGRNVHCVAERSGEDGYAAIPEPLSGAVPGGPPGRAGGARGRTACDDRRARTGAEARPAGGATAAAAAAGPVW